MDSFLKAMLALSRPSKETKKQKALRLEQAAIDEAKAQEEISKKEAINKRLRREKKEMQRWDANEMANYPFDAGMPPQDKGNPYYAYGIEGRDEYSLRMLAFMNDRDEYHRLCEGLNALVDAIEAVHLDASQKIADLVIFTKRYY